MKRNPSMTEEEWRLFELWNGAHALSPSDLVSLEDQLRIDQFNMDARVQLFAYYYRHEGNNLKHPNAEQNLFRHVEWFIENKPSVRDLLGHRLAMAGTCFKPRSFGILRQKWLEQVSAAPSNGTVIGNAASFIGWNDLETASYLFERAYALQPTAGWLETFVLHCNSRLWGAPALYKDQIRRQVVDVGVRSLKSEPGGAPFLTCEYVSDAALTLGRYELVHRCAEILCKWGHPACEQMANAYLGLVALRENDRELAVQLMLKTKRGYGPQPVVFRLARELFDSGERESIVQLIKGFKRKIKTSTKNQWLAQIANNEPPGFEDYCC
jgi:hypothetical protein